MPSRDDILMRRIDRYIYCAWISSQLCCMVVCGRRRSLSFGEKKGIVCAFKCLHISSFNTDVQSVLQQELQSYGEIDKLCTCKIDCFTQFF